MLDFFLFLLLLTLLPLLLELLGLRSKEVCVAALELLHACLQLLLGKLLRTLRKLRLELSISLLLSTGPLMVFLLKEMILSVVREHHKVCSEPLLITMTQGAVFIEGKLSLCSRLRRGDRLAIVIGRVSMLLLLNHCRNVIEIHYGLETVVQFHKGNLLVFGGHKQSAEFGVKLLICLQMGLQET